MINFRFWNHRFKFKVRKNFYIIITKFQIFFVYKPNKDTVIIINDIEI